MAQWLERWLDADRRQFDTGCGTGVCIVYCHRAVISQPRCLGILTFCSGIWLAVPRLLSVGLGSPAWRRTRPTRPRRLVTSWPHPAPTLAKSCSQPGRMLAPSCPHPGHILATSWPHPGHILASDCFARLPRPPCRRPQPRQFRPSWHILVAS